MNVQVVNSSSNVYNTNKKNEVSKRYPEENQKNPSTKVAGDSLTLSEDAKKIQLVKSRIDTGYYEKPEVIQQVAKKLNEEFNKV
jgi:hypothetical protein